MSIIGGGGHKESYVNWTHCDAKISCPKLCCSRSPRFRQLYIFHALRKVVLKNLCLKAVFTCNRDIDQGRNDIEDEVLEKTVN